MKAPHIPQGAGHAPQFDPATGLPYVDWSRVHPRDVDRVERIGSKVVVHFKDPLPALRAALEGEAQ